MAASPHLSRKLKDAVGNDAGDELIGVLDRAANDISDLRGDVAELRHQVEVGFARIDARFEQLEARMGALEKQNRLSFVAWGVILVAVIGLYAR